MARQGPLVVMASPGFDGADDNPYVGLLYASVAEADPGIEIRDFSWMAAVRSRIDVLHIHWPEALFATRRGLRTVKALVFIGMLRVLRLRGTRFVATIHNEGPHDGFPSRAAQLAYRYWLRQTDLRIHLGGRSTDGGDVVISHGDYRRVLGAIPSRLEARAALDLPATAPVMLAIGRLRRYKNLQELIEAFLAMPDSDARLVIAGDSSYDPQLLAELQATAKSSDRVVVIAEDLTPQRQAQLLAACDLVVLPYKAILNSGSALLALSAGRPLLAPRLGTLVELADQVGDSWLLTYDPPLTGLHLERAGEWAATPRPQSPDLSPYDWHTIGAATAQAYRSVAAGT